MFVVVEGSTEESFVNHVLAPELWAHDVYATATIVGTPKRRGSAVLNKGGGDWPRWQRDIRRLLGEQSQADVRVTTLFDLYGLPTGFPGLSIHRTEMNTSRRCDKLEAELGSAYDDSRLIPYLQRHEFEALVLAALPSLRRILDSPDDLAGLDALEEEIAGWAPEDIDDGAATSPSKRLLSRIPGYRKTVHGSLVVEDAGLTTLRSKCPRFDSWVRRLEALRRDPQ